MSDSFPVDNSLSSYLVIFRFLILWHLPLKLDNNYKIWKGASFVVLPYGFIFVCTLLATSKNSKQLLLHYSKFFFYLAIILSIFSFYKSYKLYIFSFSKPLYNLINIKKELLTYKNFNKQIILDTESHRDTNIAFNLFSKEFKIYPLNDFYGIPFKFNEIKPDGYYVISEDCNNKKKYILIKDLYQAFYYQFGNGGCGLIKKSFSFYGLSGSESSGRWSDSKNVTFNFDLNLFQNTKLKPKQISFLVSPYKPSENIDYRIDIYVNKIFLKSEKITSLSNIIIPLNNFNKEINVSFVIDKTLRPFDYGSNDQRNLALFFYNAVYNF